LQVKTSLQILISLVLQNKSFTKQELYKTRALQNKSFTKQELYKTRAL